MSLLNPVIPIPKPTLGKYQLLADIGHGGMADVYLAASEGPGGFSKLVVVKALRRPLNSDSVFLLMFLNEARLAARLSHPNVVHTYEVGAEEGRVFIAMEYLDGHGFDEQAYLRAESQHISEANPGVSCQNGVLVPLKTLTEGTELRRSQRAVHAGLSLT